MYGSAVLRILLGILACLSKSVHKPHPLGIRRRGWGSLRLYDVAASAIAAAMYDVCVFARCARNTRIKKLWSLPLYFARMVGVASCGAGVSTLKHSLNQGTKYLFVEMCTKRTSSRIESETKPVYYDTMYFSSALCRGVENLPSSRLNLPGSKTPRRR